MAIFHLHAKTAQKGKQSAAAASAYITRQGAYARHGELVFCGHGHMPTWAQDDAQSYWKAADAGERANGRLFKGIEAALPRELSPDQQLALAQAFCEQVATVKDGKLPYSFAIHCDPKGHNPHLHIMISERITDALDRGPESHFKRYNAKSPEKGGSRKTEALKPTEWLLETRRVWAEMANDALDKAGVYASIDHRSYDEQGIGLYPTPHLGPNVKAMEAKGKQTRKMQEWREKKADRLRSMPNERQDAFYREMQELAAEAQAEEEAAMAEMDRTRDAVKRQIEAMACDLYQVGIYDPAKGMIQKEYTPDQLMKSIDYLKRENARGQDIYIRPAESTNAPLVLIDDIASNAMNKLKLRGLIPAAIIETSPGNCQAWIKLGKSQIEPEIRAHIAKSLAIDLGTDQASAEKRHYGRLAGFTNRKPQHQQANGYYPYVLCRASGGWITPDGENMVEKAREAVAKKVASRKEHSFQADTSHESARELYDRYWQEWDQNRHGPQDLSKGDWAVACRLAKEGHSAEAIADAIYEKSPGLQAGTRARKETEAKALAYARNKADDAVAHYATQPEPTQSLSPRPGR